MARCLYVNLAIAVPTAILSLRLLVNDAQTNRPHIDLPGVLTGSAGLFAVVYGFSNAETHSWSHPVTIIALAASTILLCLFVAIERRRAHPRCRCTSSQTARGAGPTRRSGSPARDVLGAFLFLTYFIQENRDSRRCHWPGVPADARADGGHLDDRPDANPEKNRSQAADHGRDAHGCGRDGLLTRLSPSSELRRQRPARAHRPRPGTGRDLARRRHRDAQVPPATRRASPRRWSTPFSRSAARSAPRS